MTMQELAYRLLYCINNGADPDQPVMIYDADAEEILEVKSFTYEGGECQLFCDED